MKLAILLSLLIASAAHAAPIQFVDSAVTYESDAWRFTLTTDRPISLPSDRVYFIAAEPHLVYVNSTTWHDGLAPVNTIANIVCDSMNACVGVPKNFEVPYVIDGATWSALMPAELVPFDPLSSWPYTWRGRTDGELAFEVAGFVGTPAAAVSEPKGVVLAVIGAAFRFFCRRKSGKKRTLCAE